MKSVYERSKLIISQFDTDDVIVTSVITPIPDPAEPPVTPLYEKENSYQKFRTFQMPGKWF